MKTREEKILAVFLDGDGCVYNKKYHDLLLFVDYFLKKAGNNPLARKQYIDQLTNALFFCDIDSEEFKNQIKQIEIARKKDGAPYHPSYKTIEQMEQQLQDDDRLMSTILFKAIEKTIIKSILEKTNQNTYNKIVFMSGSNRQSKKSDDLARMTNGTGCFMKDLKNLVRYLPVFLYGKWSISPENVLFDPLLMADLEENLPYGTSLEKIINDSGSTEMLHPDYTFDTSKFTIHYAFLNYLATHSEYQSKKIDVMSFDDTVKIHEDLVNIFCDNNDLIPYPISNFALYHYSLKNDVIINRVSIVGNGGIQDFNFQNNTKLICNVCKVPNHLTINAVQTFDVQAFKQARDVYKPMPPWNRPFNFFQQPDITSLSLPSLTQSERLENRLVLIDSRNN